MVSGINYFYTMYYYPNVSLINKSIQNNGGIGFQISTGWGKDKLSWTTHEGI